MKDVQHECEQCKEYKRQRDEARAYFQQLLDAMDELEKLQQQNFNMLKRGPIANGKDIEYPMRGMQQQEASLLQGQVPEVLGAGLRGVSVHGSKTAGLEPDFGGQPARPEADHQRSEAGARGPQGHGHVLVSPEAED